MNLLKGLKNLASDVTGTSGPTQEWYITAERAEGLRDKDRFSKSDPYLKISFGGKHVKTRTIKNDLSPYWNETFRFQLTSGQVGDIHISIMDDDIGFDDSIGSAVISRGDLPSRAGEEKFLKVPIFSKQQVSGIVHLRVKLLSDGQMSSNNTYQQSSNISYPSQQQTSSTNNQYSYGSQQQQTYPSNPQYNQTQPQSSYYSQNQPSYNQNQPSYNQNQPSYNQNQPSYNQNQPYNQSQPYSQSQPSYSQSQPPYNQNQYNQGQMPPMMNQQFQPPQQQYMNQPPQQSYMGQQPQSNYGNQYDRRY